MKLLAAEQPEQYGRAAGLGPLIDRLENRIDAQVAAEVATLGETLHREIVDFVTAVFDRLLPIIASLAEGAIGLPARRGPPAPEISPNPSDP